MPLPGAASVHPGRFSNVRLLREQGKSRTDDEEVLRQKRGEWDFDAVAGGRGSGSVTSEHALRHHSSRYKIPARSKEFLNATVVGTVDY